MFTDLLLRARALFRRQVVETELDDELRDHLDSQIQKHLDAGMSPEDATRRAHLEFGGLDLAKEACRDARGLSTLDMLARDVQYAARILRRDPTFTIVAALTLALGIGATTTVFSVVNTVLLKTLPYHEVERVVFPWMLAPPTANLGFDEIPWSRKNFQTFAGQAQSFEHVGAFLRDAFNLTGSGEAARYEGARVSEGFFPTLGVAPQLGRVFTEDEDRVGAAQVVMLSDRVWRERFNADPTVIGRALTLNGVSHTVIGVMPGGFGFPRVAGMPSGFPFPHETDVWVPLALSTGPRVRGEPSLLAVFGRLRPRVSYEQAQAEMNLFTRQLERENPRGIGWFNTRITPMTTQITGETRQPLLLLLAAVGVLLLIACSNIANLSLTRAIARTREFTLRAALGAGRGRLIRQLVTETLLLAAISGTIGIGLAYLGVAGVRTFGPVTIPQLSDVTVDPRVIAFAAFVTIGTGLLLGIVPAIIAGREDLVLSLKDGGARAAGSRHGARLRNTLLVLEVALALVLVAASSLLARTFVHLIRSDSGFDSARVLTFELTLPASRYPDLTHIVPMYDNVIQSVQALPGVEWAGLGQTMPLDGNGESTALRVPDLVQSHSDLRPFANYTIVSPGFLAAIGTPILHGRDFLRTDTTDSMQVAIVNDAFARKYWPGQDVIGKQVGVPINSYNMTVVGVAANVKHLSVREEVSPEIYVLFTQKPWPSMQTMHIAVRTKGEPDAVIGSIREALRRIDPEVPLARVTTLTAIVDHALAEPRFAMLLVGAFGTLALLLASVGLYGTVAYTVVGRTQEIGIRLALGAQRRQVFTMAMRQCLRLTSLGIVVGLVLAVVVLRILARFLYGVEPTDPVSLAGVAALLLGVALIACAVPARRAMRVDPLTAMRAE
jgi:predicted permease